MVISQPSELDLIIKVFSISTRQLYAAEYFTGERCDGLPIIGILCIIPFPKDKEVGVKSWSCRGMRRLHEVASNQSGQLLWALPPVFGLFAFKLAVHVRAIEHP